MTSRRIAIVFDLDNTLIDRQAAMRAWLQAQGVELDEALRRDGRGHAPRGPFFDWLGARLGEPGGALWARFRAEFPGFFHAGPAGLLERLRAMGLRVGLLSNGSGPLQRAKLQAAGLAGLFERVLISGELGCAKPSGEAFERACAALGAEPGRTLFVGDTPQDDIEGARAAGLQTCWVAADQRWPEHLAPPDHRVERVEQVEALCAGT